jgi:transitional endoplasmic reticulum ATPase
VLLAGFEDEDKPNFASMIKGQIKALRKQLDKTSNKFLVAPAATYAPSRSEHASRRDFRALLDELSRSGVRSDSNLRRVYTTIPDVPQPPTSGYNESHVRMLLDALSDSTGSPWRAAGPSNRIYATQVKDSVESLSIPGSMPLRGPPPGDRSSRYVSEMYKPLPPSP